MAKLILIAKLLVALCGTGSYLITFGGGNVNRESSIVNSQWPVRKSETINVKGNLHKCIGIVFNSSISILELTGTIFYFYIERSLLVIGYYLYLWL
jgi:hypothetical protein